jgi:hypothetical protein
MAIHKGSDDQADDQAVDPTSRDSEESSAHEEPLCSEEEFAQEVRDLVAADAPQVFALVEERGERTDGRIVAWGIAFDDHVDVLSVSGGRHVSLPSVEFAHRAFSQHRKICLVWASPAAPRQSEQVG